MKKIKKKSYQDKIKKKDEFLILDDVYEIRYLNWQINKF